MEELSFSNQDPHAIKDSGVKRVSDDEHIDHPYALPPFMPLESDLGQLASSYNVTASDFSDSHIFDDFVTVSGLPLGVPEVVIPSDTGEEMAPQPSEIPAIQAKQPEPKSKKRKRRRKNVYDFKPRRKKSKMKKSGNVEMSASAEDADLMFALKGLYENSKIKQDQDRLFLGDNNGAQNQIYERLPGTLPDIQDVQNGSSIVNASQFSIDNLDTQEEPLDLSVKRKAEHFSIQPASLAKPERKLTQTTCCQYYRQKKSKTEDAGRKYRRRNGLWLKGDRVSQRLLVKNKKFPFQELPILCQMKIFILLDPVSRGVASQVCSDWSKLASDADTWRVLDLDFLSAEIDQISPNLKDPKRRANMRNEFLKRRIACFATHMSKLKPRLRSLSFQFDIGHIKDNWFSHIEAILEGADVRLLEKIRIDWQTTPGKCVCYSGHCCIFNKVRVLFRLHFTRLYVFRRMMQYLTRYASKVKDVTMPFDWSPSSVLLVSHWALLRKVDFLPYLSMLDPTQTTLDAFLRSHQHLESLQFTVCVPLYSNPTMFSLSHTRLSSLNLGKSTGFILKSINLPNLKELTLSLEDWKGVLANEKQELVPCVYQVIRKGAPKLQELNRHILACYWNEFLYDDLGTVLSKVCFCKLHRVQENSEN